MELAALPNAETPGMCEARPPRAPPAMPDKAPVAPPFSAEPRFPPGLRSPPAAPARPAATGPTPGINDKPASTSGFERTEPAAWPMFVATWPMPPSALLSQLTSCSYLPFVGRHCLVYCNYEKNAISRTSRTYGCDTWHQRVLGLAGVHEQRVRQGDSSGRCPRTAFVVCPSRSVHSARWARARWHVVGPSLPEPTLRQSATP